MSASSSYEHTQQRYLELCCWTSVSISSAGFTAECDRASSTLPDISEWTSADEGGWVSADEGGWVSADRCSRYCKKFPPAVTPSRPRWRRTIRCTRAASIESVKHRHNSGLCAVGSQSQLRRSFGLGTTSRCWCMLDVGQGCTDLGPGPPV